MKWLKKLFNKNRQLKIEPVPPMPSWDKIVELLYDKNWDSFCDEVINVLYSKDNSMRYVVLKDEKDIFTYQLEAIYQFDEDVWNFHTSFFLCGFILHRFNNNMIMVLMIQS